MAHQDGRARVSPELPQTPGGLPQAGAGGCKVAIRRTGQSVEITLTSSSEYASIELYDSLVRSVDRGSLRLELNLSRP